MTPRLYISEIDATATADEAIFSRYRLDKLRAAKSAARRAEGICAERLLIYALRDTMPEIEFPVEIVTDKSGKPELADVPLRFSLSHSGDRCACAVYDRAIGVDIQKRAAADVRILERRFTPCEREFVLNSADRGAAFTRVWTMKESYVKAHGTGIPLNSFCTIGGLAGTMRTAEHGGYFCSVYISDEPSAELEIKIL